jgi:hypothetical protein
VSDRVSAEWMRATVHTPADLLPESPRAVIIGVNPAPSSVEAGASLPEAAPPALVATAHELRTAGDRTGTVEGRLRPSMRWRACAKCGPGVEKFVRLADEVTP